MESTVKDNSTVKFFLPVPDRQVVDMLKRNGFEWCNKQEAADFVVFTGGSDVHPALYGETLHSTTYFDGVRDNLDIAAWNRCRNDQVKVGICRGGQFLNVMNNGALWQNVSGHAIRGTHIMRSVATNRTLYVTSTHHQMIIPSSKADVLYVANLARNKESATKTKTYSPEERTAVWDDVEVCVYERTHSLCYQPHPEYEELGNKDNERLFIDLILEMLVHGKVPTTGRSILGAQCTQASEEAASTVRH